MQSGWVLEQLKSTCTKRMVIVIAQIKDSVIEQVVGFIYRSIMDKWKTKVVDSFHTKKSKNKRKHTVASHTGFILSTLRVCCVHCSVEEAEGLLEEEMEDIEEALRCDEVS